MRQTIMVDKLNKNDLSLFLEMAGLLVRKGLLTKKQAEITLQRIASENVLSPIYL